MSVLRDLMWPYYWKTRPLTKSCLATMSVLFGYPPTPHFPFLRKNGVFSKGLVQNRTGLCLPSPFDEHGPLRLGLPPSEEHPSVVLYNNMVTFLSSLLQPRREEVPFRHQVTMEHPTLPSPSKAPWRVFQIRVNSIW